MINELIALFDASVFPPVATRYGLATLGERGPLQHVGGDQYVPIAVDNTAPWSYWRVGEIRSSPYDLFTCEPGALHKVTFRLVLLLPNTCNAQSILIAAGNGVASSMPSARTMLGAVRAKVVGQRTSTDGVAQQERIDNLPLQWSLLALDVDVEIVGTATCLIGCEDSPSALCAIIATASNAEVVACLGDRVDEICDGSGPCAPTTLNGVEIVGTAGIVKQGGVQVGTVDPATGIVTVPECDPCPVMISLEGVHIANVTDPCATPSVALECSDLVDAVVVEFDGRGSELFVREGSSDGRPYYVATSGDSIVYTFIDTDFAWAVFTDSIIGGGYLTAVWTSGSDVSFPWEANPFTWTGGEGDPVAITVRQATIGDICGGGSCPMTVNVTVNGVAQTPITSVDPCVETNLNIVIA